ncbi:MAG: energy transducer TonB [Actinomycetota bacterium]
MRPQESVPAPRGWTGEAAWKGTGASILLHLFVGAALIAALSGPPKLSPRVIDLTLLAPDGIDRPPGRAALVRRVEPPGPGTAVHPEPTTLPASPAVTNPPAATAQENASDPAAGRSASAHGSPHPSVSAPAPVAPYPTGQGSARGDSGSPPAPSGAGPPAADFAWIRDAIQHAIAYPATARRMGWEGKVVVAFQLLSDGSVRDVRVVQGSGHAALDRGAIDAVRNASPFPRSPIEAEVVTPIVYRLTTR